MSELSNDYIEEAFAQVRARFEKRNNETGIDILNSYEEQWEASGSLSSRQYEWLEKQLDGSWKQDIGPATRPDDGEASAVREPDVIRFPAMDRDMERRIDVMISRKLAEPGTTVVELSQLDELEKTINGLLLAVRAMR